MVRTAHPTRGPQRGIPAYRGGNVGDSGEPRAPWPAKGPHTPRNQAPQKEIFKPQAPNHPFSPHFLGPTRPPWALRTCVWRWCPSAAPQARRRARFSRQTPPRPWGPGACGHLHLLGPRLPLTPCPAANRHASETQRPGQAWDEESKPFRALLPHHHPSSRRGRGGRKYPFPPAPDKRPPQKAPIPAQK